MARQAIQIQSVSEIRVSKNKREYFTLEDMAQIRYVCFNPKLHSLCLIGDEIDADVEPAKSEGDTPRLTNIYIDNKPIIEAETKAKQRASWGGKSDKELAQQKQLAESQNRSIQAQTSLNRAVDLAIAGQIAPERCEETAKHFYLFLQSLVAISEAEVIQRKIAEIKGSEVEAQTSEKVKSNETGVVEPAERAPVPSPSKGEAPQTKEELFTWIRTHKKLTTDSGVLSFITNVCKIDESRIETDLPGVYQEIKELMGWS